MLWRWRSAMPIRYLIITPLKWRFNMYAFIRGRLVQASPHYCLIDVAGIGYKLHIAANTFGKMPQTGEELLLHSSFQVRESSHTLYGFLNETERDLFELLLNVSGIGPKLALSIIGHLS